VVSVTRSKAKGRRVDSGLLKMGELAQRTDTPKETIHYYLRLGLLSPPVETSRNMAYYGERHVEELRSIARLQAESYLPLDKIKVLLDEERRASADRARDLAGDLFGRGARLALEPLDRAGLARRSGLDLARVDEAVSAGLLGRSGGGFGWEDLRIAEVLAEAGDDAVVERLHILDRHVRGMVDDELGHFFAMIAAGIDPDRGLELLHGAR
jgi:DNA-binding transcriptional MerR regulator